MEREFKHSIKVPTQYRRTAAVLKTALEQRKKSLKSLIFEEKHARVRGMQAVLKQYIENRGVIDSAIEKSKILEENSRLCPTLCKVLVTELIFGRKQLNGDSRPVVTVRNYSERIQEILTNNTAEVQSAITTKKDIKKPRYVRINRNLLCIADALEMLAAEEWRHKKPSTPYETYGEFLESINTLKEDEFMIDMHMEDLLVFHAKQRYYWACHNYVKEKKFMLQDKGTCFVAELLQPTAGSVLLDMCAAPGIKTIHLCNIMQNKGIIYAVEQNTVRYRLLCNMTEAANCEIVKPILSDAFAIDSKQCPDVEYILVDPSCSGSGMPRMSLDSDVKDEVRLRKLAGLQIKMLSHAMRNFSGVKRIAYSTCSLYEEENEQVIQRCLELNPQFKLLSCKKALRNKWLHVGNTKYANIGKNCIYTRPDEDLTDGIFIAILERRREE